LIDFTEERVLVKDYRALLKVLQDPLGGYWEAVGWTADTYDQVWLRTVSQPADNPGDVIFVEIRPSDKSSLRLE
jgi:hypothetical protein